MKQTEAERLILENEALRRRVGELEEAARPRQQAEESLRLCDERQRTVLAHLSAGIVVIGNDDRVELVNQTFLDAFQIAGPPEAYAGLATSRVLAQILPHFADPEGTARRMAELVGRGESAASVEMVLRDGRVGAVDFVPLPRGRMWVHRDITERKRTESALRASEAQLDNALKIANAGSWEYDVAEDRFTFNDSFYRIFHTTAAAMRGYRMSSADYARRFVHPEDAAMVGAEVAAAIAAKDPNFSRQLEHRILYADGGVGFISVRFVIVKDDTGRTVRTYGVNQDITEQKRAEVERERLRANLAQSDRLASMGMLAAGVAHEINNPLSYILFNLESLAGELPKLMNLMRRCHAALAERVGFAALGEVLGEEDKVFRPEVFEDAIARLREALAGTQRIRGISRSLGTFSRVERTEVAPVEVNASIEHALTMAFNEIKYRARLVKDFSPVPPVLATDGKLAQVFLNLLVNAAHAIGEGHVEHNQIRVRTWLDGETVCAEVSDSGQGIAPEHQAHIFDPFFTTKGVGVGTGIGLSICRSIVTEFGGQIAFTTELGKGTRFLVKLPRLPAGWGKPQESRGAEPSPRASVKGRILVVDDEEGIRAIMARMLGGQHELVAVASGQEAQAVLKEDRRFDLLLFDLMMPRMSGMELHAWLREQDAGLADKVVFMTGGAFTPGSSDYLAKAKNARVEKPFDVDGFPRMVEQLVLAARSRG